MNEDAFVQRLCAIHAVRSAGVALGIGDDAAILDGRERLVGDGSVPEAGGSIVVTVDDHVQDAHFRVGWLSPRALGRRALVAAASDVLAMGALPWVALSAVIWGPYPLGGGEDRPAGASSDPARDVLALSEGTEAAAKELGLTIVGGNVARGTAWALSSTVLGRGAGFVTRKGARPGDGLFASGPLGLSRGGLLQLLAGGVPILDCVEDASNEALKAWAFPTLDLEAAASLSQWATSALDVSDGLRVDGLRLAQACGVALAIDEVAVRALGGRSLEAAAERVGESALELALTGGEDYVLLATGAACPSPRFVRIGEVVEGEGLWLRRAGSLGLERVSPGGHDHFVGSRR
jgi:thiamine-monophosphate kinase